MKKALIAVLVLLILGGAGAGAFLWWRERQLVAFAAAPFGASEAKVVEVPPGTGPKALGALLAKADVVQDGELFYRFVRRENAGPRLKAGEYEFTGALTPKQVLEKLVSGDVKKYRFTVPEGLRLEEILPILAASELKLDAAKLEVLSRDAAFLQKAQVPASRLEGYLYPDTYTFTRGATEESVLAKMVARTLEEYRKADAVRKSGITLNLHQTMTLASIVEKETAAPEERPRISCVFHNRLKLKMPLGTDPTVIYAMKELRGVYNKNITRADLRTDHPYNTYVRKGLPPGPIANAGAEAISAALQPLDCSDLFFVSRNDGTHVFCPNFKCHNAAVTKWQKEFFRKSRPAAAHKGKRRRG